MVRLARKRAMVLACGLAIGLVPGGAPAAAVAAEPVCSASDAARDGQRDFDFEIGNWTTDVRVLRNPLSDQSPVWADYHGTSVVRGLQQGRANVVELSVAGAAGAIEGLSLRLYDPQTRRWTLNYASLRDGTLTAPVLGCFDGAGRGVFYGHDRVGERAVRVRFVIEQASADEAHFEQAFSADDGATWEVNWIAVDKRR